MIFPTDDYTKPRATPAEAPDAAGAADAASGCRSAMPTPPGYAPADLVLDDAFCEKTLDRTKWRPYAPGFDNHGQLTGERSGPDEGSFEAQYFDPSQVTVGDGLRLIAEPDGAIAGYTAKSGVITTTPAVRFAGGAARRTYLQVRAKIPSKNGMWPKLYLGPLPGVTATPVGVLTTGFVDWGPTKALSIIQTSVAGAGAYHDTGIDLSADFFDYGVEIVWGESVTWFWNRVGGARESIREVQKGDGGTIPSSADGETLFIELAVVNGKDGSDAWHSVWNGSDVDALAVAAVQAYAR